MRHFVYFLFSFSLILLGILPFSELALAEHFYAVSAPFSAEMTKENAQAQDLRSMNRQSPHEDRAQKARISMLLNSPSKTIPQVNSEASNFSVSKTCTKTGAPGAEHIPIHMQAEVISCGDTGPLGGGLEVTYMSDTTQGGEGSRFFQCPVGQKIVSCPPSVQSPSGAHVCNTSIQNDGNRCGYNYCNPASGQHWNHRAICAGPVAE